MRVRTSGPLVLALLAAARGHDATPIGGGWYAVMALIAEAERR